MKTLVLIDNQNGEKFFIFGCNNFKVDIFRKKLKSVSKFKLLVKNKDEKDILKILEPNVTEKTEIQKKKDVISLISMSPECPKVNKQRSYCEPIILPKIDNFSKYQETLSGYISLFDSNSYGLDLDLPLDNLDDVYDLFPHVRY